MKGSMSDGILRIEDLTKVLSHRICSSTKVDDMFAFLCYDCARAFYFLGHMKVCHGKSTSETGYNYSKLIAIFEYLRPG